MADNCPKCGETLMTRTIQKKLGVESIDFPVAQICPKCNWSRDLTGAGDIVVKPPVQEGTGTTKEKTPATAGQAQENPEHAPGKSKSPQEKTRQLREKQGNVIEKPKQTIDQTRQHASAPAKRTLDMNKIITLGLALLVIAAIIWAIIPRSSETPVEIKPEQTPTVTAVVDVNSNPQVEATPTGIKKMVKMDRDRGYLDPNQRNLNIKPGDAVVWRNDGSYSLNLSSKEGLFKDYVLDYEKETLPYIFKNTGTYNFDIVVRGVKKFNGTVVVEP